MKAMITNGGPHPADKWADTSTDAILDLIQIAEDADSEQAVEARMAKRNLRTVLFDIFYGHHDGVQRTERGSLAAIKKHKDACDHCDKKLPLHDDVPSALEEINAALGATPFAAHFAQAHVQDILRAIIGQHTANVQHIERSWHRDRLAKGA